MQRWCNQWVAVEQQRSGQQRRSMTKQGRSDTLECERMRTKLPIRGATDGP